jgi:hypothetical protein
MCNYFEMEGILKVAYTTTPSPRILLNLICLHFHIDASQQKVLPNISLPTVSLSQITYILENMTSKFMEIESD